MPPEQRRRTLESAAYGTIPPDQRVLPFNYVPVILKQYGVTEAHTRPLVGRRRADDTIRTWRSAPHRAWLQPLVEWTRTGHCYVALAFDLDEQIAIERVATANMGSTAIPCPNLVVYRKLTGHAHAIYTLKRPVFRGPKAKPFPIAVLARCSEWLLGILHGDAGFTGVLVSNPTHADYDPVWLRTEPYTLDQLRSFIPAGWRRPKVPRTDVGRNCDLFRELMRFAGVRVPTRFVLKYTLRRRSEASGAHEAVEGGPGHAGDLGDGGLGDAQLEEAADLVLLAVEP